MLATVKKRKRILLIETAAIFGFAVFLYFFWQK
jgi:hypothetical protein